MWEYMLQWQRLEGCSSIAPNIVLPGFLDMQSVNGWMAFYSSMFDLHVSLDAWLISGSKLWASCYMVY